MGDEVANDERITKKQRMVWDHVSGDVVSDQGVVAKQMEAQERHKIVPMVQKADE